MKTEPLQDVLAWLRSTDLVEVSFRQDGEGFTLATSAPGAAPDAGWPGRFVAVTAPAVGVFHWNEPGRARPVEDGGAAAEGALLGIIETARGRFAPVTAARPGRLARVLVDEGAAVEFGQPLFFLESA